MSRLVRGGLALCVGFGFALLAIKVADQGHDHGLPPGTQLGGVDFNEYCRQAYGNASTARLTKSEGAYGWRCWTTVNGIITYHDIDVHDACELLYDGPVYDDTANVNDPYSWQCFRGPSPD
ncbi:MAG: hypothetical protein WCC60_16920 [Ilumatobacteraceae bacterium]